ncbi:MAG: PSD1 and planctomycete cytochrome C domain-containing protein [Opitutaceae bacterium]|nr:PSD1 and planctomycete cytochrome C domain-containing protein [Opitutaceae bacterium]
MIPLRFVLLSLLAAFMAGPLLRAAEPIDFNRQILPILSDACFHCHGPDGATREAKLRLDQRDGLFRTHDEVTVVTPGHPEKSELFLRITSKEEDEVMPPPKATRRLKSAEIELLKTWIASGAKWSGHWAYEAPRRPAVPGGLEEREKEKSPPLPPNPIDAFVHATLSKQGLSPAPAAAPATLLRRVSLDLTGVPPSAVELEAFLADPSPGSYERAVDRLLASPRYGERWAWDWLDLARYADTNGFQGDPERTMWPWRDWVVNALNANMPYDQFTIEQLAGDLLPDATRDQKLASGFHRNNMFNGEGGRIAEETRVENVFDRVETTATVWMGLTFTCARCHDHKFDPIKQTDYFALYDIFNQMSETGSASGGGGRSGAIVPVLDLSTPAEAEAVQRAQAGIDAVAKEIEVFELTKFPRAEGKPVIDSPTAQKLPGNLPATHARPAVNRRDLNGLLEALPFFRDTEPDPEYVKLLQKHIAAIRVRERAANNITKVMIMDELPKKRDTFVLSKGNYESKTDVKVLGALPEIFRPTQAAAASPSENPARLNRLDLAQWLVSPGNPLGARTAVNRAWQAFFGTGIVKTPEDFGVQSGSPSHPELLDWLATEYVASGWDTKKLHRLIVTSATYRQSSRVTPALHERDPENRLLARGPRHRLPSWMLRDQALAAAGLLVEQRGGPSVKPYQPAGIWEEATFGKKSYQQDHGEALYRRSLYVFWRRIVGPTSFFDAGARQVCTVKVPHTNTPLHALVTLNDPAFVEAARVMAQRALKGPARTDSARLDAVFRGATARLPSAQEKFILLSRLAQLRTQFGATPVEAHQLAGVGEFERPESIPVVEHAAWTALCSLILNLDEALSKE